MRCIAGRAVLFLLLIILGPACSFVFVEGVPDYHRGLPPEEPVDCTSARAAPMVDTMLASGALVSMIVAANADDDDSEAVSSSQDASLATSATLAGAFAASAIYGYVVTQRCYDEKAKRARRLGRAWRRSQSERRAAERQAAEQGGAQQDASRPGAVVDSEAAPGAEIRHRVPEREDGHEQRLSPEALERWGGPEDSAP